MDTFRQAIGMLAALMALSLPTAVDAGGLEGSNKRQLLFDLRLKPDEDLTRMERMILHAADRYGNVGFCSKAGGNATLVDYFGRPAIITSAHMFFSDAETQTCTDAELRTATFMPNVSYVDERGGYPRSFTHRKVKLVMPAINGHLTFKKPHKAFSTRDGTSIRLEEDYILFYLAEDITGDVMPDGHVRGAMRLAPLEQGTKISKTNIHGEMTMIGIAPDIRGGLATLHQSCKFNFLFSVGVSHDCDTISGSSGSMAATVVGNELRLLGVHAAGSGEKVPETDNIGYWNHAAPLPDPATFEPGAKTLWPDITQRYMEPFRNPAFVPYQLQFLLSRAGCYAGALDNKWGRGSRAAVDAFAKATGTSLPGHEPTMELWDALEEAMPEHAHACR